jgi:hypothetical protein
VKYDQHDSLVRKHNKLKIAIWEYCMVGHQTCNIDNAARYPRISLLEYPHPLRSAMDTNFSSPAGILKKPRRCTSMIGLLKTTMNNKINLVL